MKISSMAKSNLKGNLYRYIMYYLSNVFTVTAFFIFTNFLLHPEVDFRNLGGHVIAASGAIAAIIFCLIVIFVFSVLFTGYANAVFLKSRGKEFGLLSLYGMTKKQIRKYVFIENTIISILSIITGIITGGVFSKLFLMAMERFLDMDLYFNISIEAIGLSFIVFFLLFEIVSLITLLRIKDEEIINQIKTSNKPKELPSFSKKKASLGIILLVLGYGLAWIANGAMVVLLMIPVSVIVSIATYLIFTEFSIYIVNKLSKSNKVKYHKTNLIAFSQMKFKLQDTAKVLFLAAILGAITFTATETVYSFYTEADRINGFDSNEDFGLLQEGKNIYDEQLIEDIKGEFQKNKVKISSEYKIDGIKVRNLDYKEGKAEVENGFVISNSKYNELAGLYKKEEIDLSRGETYYTYPVVRYGPLGGIDDDTKLNVNKVRLEHRGKVYEFEKKGEFIGDIAFFRRVGLFDYFIVSDEDYYLLYDNSDEENLFVYRGLNFSSLRKAYEPSILVIEKLSDLGYESRAFSKSIPTMETRKSFGMILFIGFFISFLFFIASGSIIYFKLFNEIKQDKLEYDILRKIGISNRELKKIVTKQLGIIFFLPFIFSTMHSLFALKSLSNLLSMNLILNGITVMFGYLIFQIIYFLGIRKQYMKKINM